MSQPVTNTAYQLRKKLHEHFGFRHFRPGQAEAVRSVAVAYAGQSYRERQERDQLKQQQMVDYAEGRTCLWKRLLDYFGGEDLPASQQCGHCAHCSSPGNEPSACLTA